MCRGRPRTCRRRVAAWTRSRRRSARRRSSRTRCIEMTDADRRELLYGRRVGRTIGLLRELLEVSAGQRVDRLSDERREGGVDRAHASRRVEDDHAVARRVEVVLEVQRHRGVGRWTTPRQGLHARCDMLDSTESDAPRRHGAGVQPIFSGRRRIPHASLPTLGTHAGQVRTGAPARHPRPFRARRRRARASPTITSSGIQGPRSISTSSAPFA